MAVICLVKIQQIISSKGAYRMTLGQQQFVDKLCAVVAFSESRLRIAQALTLPNENADSRGSLSVSAAERATR